ncbi:FG-GAP-like repeat-containing protein [Gemmatimonadota bacterium]
MLKNKKFLTTVVMFWLALAFSVISAATDFTTLPPCQGPWITAKPRFSFPNPEAPAFRSFISGAPAGASLAATQWPLHLTIGVVRVEFQPDDSPKTTGNGTWGDIPVFTFADIDEADSLLHPCSDEYAQRFVEQLILDPSVDTRSKEYVQRHILWASQYYEAVSRGKVILEVPELADISEIYQLEHEMVEYGDDDDYSLRESRLAEDAIKIADNELDFSKYDIIMVFHAGCGGHTEFLGDTPDDIHPVSINRGLLREILADGDPNYMGIETNDQAPDGSQFFASFIQIFPETSVQDYEAPDHLEGAIYGTLGVIVHELGHYFGLPDLYDTFVGTRPTIGFFALMATGFYNTVSRIPCHPMAWSKIYLGWETPAVVTGNQENFVLKATELLGEGVRIVKVPISSTEYFLIENRLRDENFNKRFDFNELGKNNFPDVMTDDYSLPDGRFAEFDWSIPNTNALDCNLLAEIDSSQTSQLGSGILIWHIDEAVIRENLTDDLIKNWVNTDPYHLGVDLEEADGVAHMLEAFPATIDPGFGSPFDVYGGRVQGIKDETLGNLNLLFGVYTDPNSFSYTGLPSNIEIGGFNSVTVSPGSPVVDSLISLSIRFDAVPEGEHLSHPLENWPHRLMTGTRYSNPLVVDLDPGAPGAEVVQLTDDGGVYLATSTGDGSFVAAAGDSVKGSPAVGDITGDNLPELVVASMDGSILAWHLDLEGQLEAVEGWPVAPGRSFSSGPVLADVNGDGVLDVIIGSSSGSSGSQLYAIDGPTGQHIPGWPLNLDHEAAASPAVELNTAGEVQAIYIGTRAGTFYGFSPAGEELFQLDLESPVLCQPAVARLGLPSSAPVDFKVCAFGSDGRIWLIDQQGVVQPGWPVENEIVVPVDFPDSLNPGQHRLYVLEFNGATPPGFPIRITAPTVRSEPRYLSAPALADLTGDNSQEIILAVAERLALVFSGDGSPAPLARFILGAETMAAPVPADLNGDGVLDLLCSDAEGYLYGYVTGRQGVDIQWAGQGAGPRRSSINLRLQSSPGASSSTVVLPEEHCYLYPNPARGSDKVHLVYRLGREDVNRVTADILTVSGEKVAALEGQTISAEGVSNEIIWETDWIASGVYLVLIKAYSSSAGTAKLIRKVAIIK